MINGEICYMEDVFKCSKCEETKERSEFYKCKRYSTGIRQPCKVCVKIQGKLKRAEYEGKFKERPDYKICGVCGEEKSRDNFNIRSDTPTGLRSDCKSCQSVKRHEHYMENREEVLTRTSAYAKENRDFYSWRKRVRRAQDLERALIKERGYRESNREKCNAYQRKWSKDNKEKRKQTLAKYLSKSENRETRKRSSRLWRDRNKSKVAFYAAKRRAMILCATPSWVNSNKIQEFYDKAQRFNQSVDHIIPLSNPLVCGLHCEFNLQIIPLLENQQKNNSFEICEHVFPNNFEQTMRNYYG
jgi:hypothetical protein